MSRPHSNTISGGRPPNINTALCRPSNVRRNSEGSPGLPPPIYIAEPTPIDASFQKKDLSLDNIITNSNLPNSPEIKPKKSRSRNSSVTSELKESSTIQKITSRKKSLLSVDDTDGDNVSSVAVSVTGASGIYLANAKRNQDFHSLFRSVPEEDGLIEDYGCALQKEILLQGRIYISENHICFNANIFGWVTNLVIAFADIIEIEKKSTAYFIPNAIQISTDSAKHFFASFLSRDQAYELIVEIWRLSRPDLAPPKPKSIQNTEAESFITSGNDSGSCYDSDTEDSYSDEEEEEEEKSSEIVATQDTKFSTSPALPVGKSLIKNLYPNRRRAASEAIRPSYQSEDDKKTTSNENDLSKGKVVEEDSKPQLHEKTKCECTEHYPQVVMDQTYSGTLESIYNILFKNNFIEKFLVNNQKCTELEMGEWKKGEGNVVSSREFTYIKPLNGVIGPKSTKCYITDQILHQDTQNFVTVLTTTSTPDVPSGGSFSCKTKTCLTWAGNGKVKVLVTVLVDFTKSSWLKSTIEKASIDGQQTYYKELDEALKVYFKDRSGDSQGNKRSDGRKKRREKRPRSQRSPAPNDVVQEQPKSTIHQILGTISNKLADGIVSFINLASSPRTTHLTLFCLLIMVCVNVFIARKMSYVEQQLVELSRSIPMQQDATLHQEYNQQEEDELWAWLGRLDPDSQVTEKVKHLKEPQSDSDMIWNDAIILTKQAKDRLDKHMVELSQMIQKAEHSLEDVTKVVSEQRKKIKNDSI